MGVHLSFEAKLKKYRISKDEYQRICSLLGREPKDIEWPLFSALWSEHCSYKSSRKHLKIFAETYNAEVQNAVGENAGIIDLGQGERIAFKMESHNHPSFIEPFQGAATGVGGILRDIFTMGARPIALANYLCFGELSAPRMKYLVNGVVRGISSYGNCVGVPTVTGQTEFDSSYDSNILVNAMAVGYLGPQDPVALSAAKGVGNWIVYIGAKTGKDGVHGAAMASESFDEDSESKKPNVQIGDPFFEKLLIESCLEALKQNLIVSIQDMGAAGLTSSSFEMSSKGQVGMDLHLDQVPIRDVTMTPEEILLSESQERMLAICEPGKFRQLESIFNHWGLDAAKVGEVTKDRKVKLFWKGEVLTEIDPDLLVENAPIYDRGYHEWKPRRTEQFSAVDKGSAQKIFETGLFSEKKGSRSAIFHQYDQRVGLRTMHDATHDVALVRLPSGRLLSIALGCRPELMRRDAQVGAWDSIAYPTLQMALKGAKAIAATDCLNFGNPEKSEIMSEFVASVRGIRDVCVTLDVPVISGNVSFYNETLGKNITSTPATGIVGLKQAANSAPKDFFSGAGNSVVSLIWNWGELTNAIEKDKQIKGCHKEKIEELSRLRDLLIALSQEKFVFSNQAVGLHGLGHELARMCTTGIGMRVEKSLSAERLIRPRMYEFIFEVDAPKSFFEKVENLETSLNLKLEKNVLGYTGGNSFEVYDELQWPLGKLQAGYSKALSPVFGDYR